MNPVEDNLGDKTGSHFAAHDDDAKGEAGGNLGQIVANGRGPDGPLQHHTMTKTASTKLKSSFGSSSSICKAVLLVQQQ